MMDAEYASLEARVEQLAPRFPYPPTPDIAGRLQERRSPVRPRLAWAAVVAVLALVAGLLAVPGARATVFEAIQLGAVRVFLGPPTATPTPTAQTNPASNLPSATARFLAPSPTPTSTPFPLISLLDLAGETTLEGAQAQVDFPIRLPAYPADLGPPAHVFLQNLGGEMVILAWTEPDRPDVVRMSLHIIGREVAIEKNDPAVIRPTVVNGEFALWMQGPYLVRVRSGAVSSSRLVEGNVLLWVEDGLTYRLETDLPLDEAIRVAESLR